VWSLLDLQVWINHPLLRGAVTHYLFVDIYKTLSKEGIEIPSRRGICG
jgi:hypothetical protein